MADRADALGDLLSLPGEVVVLLTRCFDVLRDLCQMRCCLCRATWTIVVRLASGGMALLLHPVKRFVRLHDDLCGRSHFGSHGS
jgi:hypothetical protein